MKRVYYKSKWTSRDLTEKKIEFKLTAPTGYAKGVGTLRVHVKGDLVSVDIDVPDVRHGWYNLISLFDASLVDKIEPHPDNAVADFRLLA